MYQHKFMIFDYFNTFYALLKNTLSADNKKLFEEIPEIFRKIGRAERGFYFYGHV
jgi:hypothetical protein